MKPITVWLCGKPGISFEEQWALAEQDRLEEARDLEEDLRIEAELNPPTESAHVEYEDAFWAELYYLDTPLSDDTLNEGEDSDVELEDAA